MEGPAPSTRYRRLLRPQLAATVLQLAATVLRDAATVLHFAATVLHVAATVLHLAATELHVAATVLQCADTELQLAATVLQLAATVLQLAATVLHVAATVPAKISGALGQGESTVSRSMWPTGLGGSRLLMTLSKLSRNSGSLHARTIVATGSSEGPRVTPIGVENSSARCISYDQAENPATAIGRKIL